MFQLPQQAEGGSGQCGGLMSERASKREKEGWSSDNKAGSVTRLSQTHRKSSAHNAQPPAQNGAGRRGEGLLLRGLALLWV